MIIEELVARLGFTVEGLDQLRRAAEVFKRLQKAILAFAAVIAKRLGRIGIILARVSLGLVKFGAGFIARTALITGAAGVASAALARLAASFARLRQATIDSARVGGIPIRELALVETVMKRVGASAEDARKWVGEFAQKVREGAKDGGDFADALAKQGVKLTDAKGKAKAYSVVIDDVLKAADKIRDPERRRAFLTEALEGAPDQFLSQLLAATKAFDRWKQLVGESKKLGGTMSDNDILNSEDITTSLNRLQTFVQGIKDAFGSGLMAGFAKEFRQFGEYLRDLPLDDIREKFRRFAAGLADFTKSVGEGGWAVLSTVGEAIGSIVNALGRLDDATGGRLSMLAKGLGALLATVVGAAYAPMLAIAGAITGVLYAIDKFREWKAGGDTALNDFFNAIRDAAVTAKDAVDALIKSIREVLGLDTPTPQEMQKRKDARDEQFQRMKPVIDGLPENQREQYRRANPGYADWERRTTAGHGKPGDPAKPILSSPEPRLTQGYRQSENVEDRRASSQEVTGLFGSLVQMLKGLLSVKTEMAPERQVQKIADDKAVSETNNDNRTYEQKNSFSVSVTANGLGEIAGAAERGVKAAAGSIRMMTSTSGSSSP